jgi:MFS transporter, FSR family, fosmidomycin resistance protein
MWGGTKQMVFLSKWILTMQLISRDPVLQRDLSTISLVGLAHATSHFFHLMLPVLFPFLVQDFGFSFAELGRFVTLFFVVSGLGQALSGFLVDRVGARPVLFAALGCFVLSALAAACAQDAMGLALAAALAGLGNAAFHPVDFTILNQRVSSARLGHGFSVHGISGNLGWAATPIFLTSVAAWTGSWRWAVLGMGLWAVLTMLILWRYAAAIDDRMGATSVATKPLAIPLQSLAFLRQPVVWVCFLFFFFSTCALSAVQGFMVPAFGQIYASLVDKSAAYLVTAYMLFGAVGMAIGGMLVSRTARLEFLIAVCLGVSAGLVLLAGSGVFHSLAAIACVAISGLGTGIAGPSRDMLIKKSAPAGATGRVYGTVYCGLDLGFALGAPAFGALLDRHLPSSVFDGAAAALVLSAVCAHWVGRRLVHCQAPTASR